MAKIDYFNPDPERGIFGCAFAAQQYSKAKYDLSRFNAFLKELLDSMDKELDHALGMFYVSSYGPSTPFKLSAKTAIERLKYIKEKITRFTEDLEANFLGVSEAARVALNFFMTYSHEDIKIAERIATDLRKRGHNVWRDQDNIRFGESFRRAIERGIQKAHFVIFLLSPSSIESDWCQRELDMAIEKEKNGKVTVLPIIVRSCAIPPVLKTKRYLEIKNYEEDMKTFLGFLPESDNSSERAGGE